MEAVDIFIKEVSIQSLSLFFMWNCVFPFENIMILLFKLLNLIYFPKSDEIHELSQTKMETSSP